MNRLTVETQWGILGEMKSQLGVCAARYFRIPETHTVYRFSGPVNCSIRYGPYCEWREHKTHSISELVESSSEGIEEIDQDGRIIEFIKARYQNLSPAATIQKRKRALSPLSQSLLPPNVVTPRAGVRGRDIYPSSRPREYVEYRLNVSQTANRNQEDPENNLSTTLPNRR